MYFWRYKLNDIFCDILCWKKNSVMKIQNFVVSHQSRLFKLNPDWMWVWCTLRFTVYMNYHLCCLTFHRLYQNRKYRSESKGGYKHWSDEMALGKELKVFPNYLLFLFISRIAKCSRVKRIDIFYSIKFHQKRLCQTIVSTLTYCTSYHWCQSIH